MTEEKKKVLRYSLVEVPTQTALVVKDNETNTVYSGESILLEILNKVEEIRKATA